MEIVLIYRFIIVLALGLIGFILAISGREMLSGMDWEDKNLDMDEYADTR